MNGRDFRRGALLGAAVAWALPAQAGTWSADQVEIAGTTVRVERAPEATECPSASALEVALRPSVTPRARPESLDVRIAVTTDGGELTAAIVVMGARSGLRTLRAPGPGCAALGAELVAALALLLDLEGASAEGTASPRTHAVAPIPVVLEEDPESPAPRDPRARRAPPGSDRSHARARRKAERDDGSRSRGRVTVGSGLTFFVVDEPVAWLWGSFRVEKSLFSLSADALSTFDSTTDHRPGRVDVRVFGGSLRPCLRFTEGEASVVIFGCGMVGLAALRGEPVGYLPATPARYRPLVTWGGGAVGRGSLFESVFWEGSATVAVPTAKETFSIEGLGEVYRTRAAGILLGFGIGMAIW